MDSGLDDLDSNISFLPRIEFKEAPTPTAAKFTDEAKMALLNAMQNHQWTTAREAYGWVWNHLEIRVSYQTVWRFLNSKGLFAGATLRARRLKMAS